MDQRGIQDDQVMERYLQGKLLADEERAFEEAYLADQTLLDELILTEKLQQGLKSLETPRHAGADWPAWRKVFGSPQYAAAASVLLGLSLLVSGGLFVQNQTLRDSAGVASDAGGITRLVPLLTVRGDGGAEVEAPAAGEWTVFLLDAAFTEYDDYRATLTREGADAPEMVRQLDGLSPTYDGFIALGLPGRALSAGDYEILLEGRMRGWPAERGFEQLTRTPLRITAHP